MFIALERELQLQQLPALRAQDDRLAHFSELEKMEIWAGDGHHIAHATHDPRNEKGTYNPVNAIYKFDLRSGWVRFMDLVRPTARGIEHEITTLYFNNTPGTWRRITASCPDRDWIGPHLSTPTIANRTKKTITEKMDEDPFFYRRFSQLLQQAIDDYRAQRISDAEYLLRVSDVMEQVRDGKPREGPDILKERDLSRALFGALKEKLAHTQTSVVSEDTTPYRTKNDSPPADPETVMAKAACEMEDIIRRHAVVRWRENQDAQNRMRDDLDDFFVELQKKKGIILTWDQVDAIVDTAIAIAINRRDDV